MGTESAPGAPREGGEEPGPEGRDGASLTAVHLVRGVLTVHELVAAAGVPDAGAVPAAELARAAGRFCNSARPSHQPGASPCGPDRPAQSACPGPPDRALNQNPGEHSSAGAGWGGSAPGPGRTHCCREPRRSRPHSRPPRCTIACWTHSARCCTGGRSSCSGGCLQAGAGRGEQRLGAASDETLLRAWHGSHGGSPLHELPTLFLGDAGTAGALLLSPPHPTRWGLRLLTREAGPWGCGRGPLLQ